MRTIYKIEIKKPKKTFKKTLTHEQAISAINNAEQLICTIQEQFRYHIFPFIETIEIERNKYERICLINKNDKTISDLVKQLTILEAKINYAKKFITKETKTLLSYFLPYAQPNEKYQVFLDKVMNKNRLDYLPIEFIES